jgi:hypothetical protein
MNSAIEQAIAAVLEPIKDPQANDQGVPYATHSGVLELAPGLRLDVYRLSTGEAVVGETGMLAFLEFLGISQVQDA